MGFINLGSSMRYGPSGKRRKTTAWNTKKRKVTFNSDYKPVESDRMKSIREYNERYPSYTGTHKYTPLPDTSYKKEASKNYTVAIGYNKGGYQVIPNKEIKDIGK